MDVWFQVLFHSPVRSTFHLSLTVLVHYRSPVSIQPQEMVLPDSNRISRVPLYLGIYSRKSDFFRLQGYYLLWPGFPASSTKNQIFYFPASLCPSPNIPHDRRQTTRPSYTSTYFRLFPFRSPLLRKSNFFLFLWVLRCFTSPSFASEYIIPRYNDITHYWFSHRVSLDQNLFAIPQSISLLATPFFAFGAKASAIHLSCLIYYLIFKEQTK